MKRITWHSDGDTHRAQYGRYELIVMKFGERFSARMEYNGANGVIVENMETLHEAWLRAELLMVWDIIKRNGVIL